MPDLPLVDGIIEYLHENNISFCTPGHKAGKGFLHTAEGRELYDNLIKMDITEVDGVDNLHHPEGIIDSSEKLLSRLYGSRKSYFLVNGSTSGNLAMIFSVFEEGEKIIVERNCHRSIFNGIIMKKLNPVYMLSKVHSIYMAPLALDTQSAIETIRKNRDAKGIILTYPSYYGTCSDIEPIIKEAKKYGMKILVDSAHGAHFGICEGLPESALRLGADMVVTSAHKTLPAFTQSAYLHIGPGADVLKTDFYVSALTSTSPSYMLMASLDYARFYLETYGRDEYNKLIQIADKYRGKINKLGYFHVPFREELKNDIRDMDSTRYIINTEKGLSGHKLLSYLRSRRIQAEMSDSRNVVLIFSPFNGEEDFEQLYKALRECSIEDIRDASPEAPAVLYRLPQKRMLPYEINNLPKCSVKLAEAEGKICCEAVVPYPPGIPVLLPGEEFTMEETQYIESCISRGKTVLGVNNGQVVTADEKY